MNAIKSILLVSAFAVASFSQNVYRTDRVDDIKVIDVTLSDDSTDYTSYRAIKSDVDGIVKLLIKPRNSAEYITVEYLPAGVMIPVAGVKRVYRYYTGTTSTTTQVYKSNGTLVNGIKVVR